MQVILLIFFNIIHYIIIANYVSSTNANIKRIHKCYIFLIHVHTLAMILYKILLTKKKMNLTLKFKLFY